MQRRIRVALGALLAASALTAAGCATAPADDEELTLTIGTYPGSLDVLANVGWTSLIQDPVYDTLWIPTGPESASPRLATEWEFSDDGLTLSVTLRDGVIDGAGEVFDAEAFKTVLDAMIEHQQTGIGPLVSAEVVDDLTVDLHYSEYYPTALSAFGIMSITTPTMLDAEDATSHAIGTGAYLLDEEATTIGVEYVYHKRDDAWDAENARWDEIVVKVFDDPVAKLNALKSGQVDITDIQIGDTTEARSAGFELFSYNSLIWGLQFEVTGTNDPAVADIRVRQAISMAFDREAVNDNIYFGLGEPTNQAWSRGSSFYIEDLEDEYSYDPERAKELLAEAGYADGLELKIPMIAPGFDQIRPLIEQALLDIGITPVFEPTYPGYGEYYAEGTGGPYVAGTQVMFTGTAPLGLLTGLNTTAVTGTDLWTARHTPELYAEVQTVFDPSTSAEEKAEASRRVGEYILENAWYAVVVRVPSVIAYSSEIEFSGIDQPLWPGPYLSQIQPADG